MKPRSAIDYTTFDWVEVDKLKSGADVPIKRDAKHTPELVEAVRQLARAGWSDGQIAGRIHRLRTGGAVLKIRANHGIPTGHPVSAGRS